MIDLHDYLPRHTDDEFNQKYGVIIADPPWHYNNFKTAANGHPQYHCMTNEDICAIPVQKWCAKDCLVLLWVTNPKVMAAVEVVKAWGLEYITKIPWLKTSPNTENLKFGTGHWSRGCSEDLWICRFGKPKTPKKLDGTRDAPPGLLVGEDYQFFSPYEKKHSKKPEFLHQFKFKQPGPYLELFARRQYPGWHCWGNELGVELGPWGARRINRPQLKLKVA